MWAFVFRIRLRSLAVLGVLCAGCALMLQPAYSNGNDHELARQALQQGKVLPLRTVLDQIERSYNGQVIKLEFEHEDGRFIYEMRLLHPNGDVSKLEVDAVDGRVLRVRSKGRD